MTKAWRSQSLLLRTGAAMTLAVATLAVGVSPGLSRVSLAVPANTAHAAGGCNLSAAGATTKHVIYLQFDNTHLRRDVPNVPSDLEMMPHLLSFMKNNGVVLTNHHTPLMSHTSEDILTALTGVYPNRHGVATGQNSYQYYVNGSPKSFSTAFTYWTDTIGNGTYNMLSGAPTASKPTGTNAPAPWVPYTRAGCDVGGVASANQVLENANVDSKFGANDIGNVYGANSPEAQESKAQRTSDFVGIAVHCSQTDSSAGACSSGNHGRPDVLPDEPGGYSGFNALYGHKYVAPIISPSGPVTDLNGNVIKDSTGNVGFPGFDGMNAATSLGYVAAMQEHGIPVTYAYISDAHDQSGAASHTALGPGEQTYVQQLKAYDDAFAKFFTRLQNDGITPSNTLFVFTSDENDHYTGSLANNPGCTGATIDNSSSTPVVTPGNYCTYTKTETNPPTPPGPPFGEVAVGLDGLLAQQQGLNNYTFSLGNDTAPAVYLNGQPAAGDPSVRTFERATGALTVTNPLANRQDTLTQYLADPVEMNILHIVTADPSRTPTFMLFARPDYYVTATCSGGFNSAPPVAITPACVLEKPGFAWLHGNIQPDVTMTWLGLVGPNVKPVGTDNTTWSDHTDIRPTMMAMLGLTDDYVHDGRVLYEIASSALVPTGVAAQRDLLLSLGRVYKQLEAPVGQFALATLQMSTDALKSGSGTDDARYVATEALLPRFAGQRDFVAEQIRSLVEGVAFQGGTLDSAQAHSLIAMGWNLIARANETAGTAGFEVDFRSFAPGQGQVLFGTGPGCTGLVHTATQDQLAGTTEHRILVTGNDLAGTVGNTGIAPGTYWYETVTITKNGTEVDNNGGNCYAVTVTGP